MKQNPTRDLREKVLKKHMDGRLLTDYEIKYLALTSESLNRFLDKKHYQKSLNFLTKDFVEQVEMTIAEEIIGEYYKIKNRIKLKRT